MLAWLSSTRAIRSAVVAVVALALAPFAVAQESGKLDELRKLHDRLSDFRKLFKEDEGRDALTKLDELETWARDLKGEPRNMYDRARAIAFGIIGDAARAEDHFGKLPPPLSTERPALELQYFVATIAGNGPQLDEALRLMKDKAEEKDLKVISTRKRRIMMVGKEAPKLSASTQEVGEINIFERNGEPLVIDLWSVRNKPEDTHTAALRALYAEYKGQGVKFLGVNSDGPAKLADAKKFVFEKKYEWPQHYEEKNADVAPITGKGFQAGPPPWTVLIDRDGRIRAVGDPAEPVFVYALRAIVSESSLKTELVKPIPIGGEKAPKKEEPKKDKPEQVKEKKKEEVKPKSELPSNPEAKSKLDQARLYLKTGKKTDALRILREIISEYPNTREAREAEEILRSYP